VGKLLGIGGKAAPKPPRPPAPSSGLAANQQPGNTASTTLPPSAGGGFTPDQRLTIAKLDAEEAHRLRNRYDVEIQKKFSLAAACFIFVLVGAPIALRFPRGGVGLVMGVSFFIFALYYVGLIGGESLADKGLLSPFWAMWSTNVIMTVIGLALTARMGKESNSGRGGGAGEMFAILRSWIARQARRVGIPMERRVA
jgi:lipopolysaccharide export system permease protein